MTRAVFPEKIGTLLFYAIVYDANDVKHVVIQLEANGNVVIDIVPIPSSTGLHSLEGVFIRVAGEAKVLAAPGVTNAG